MTPVNYRNDFVDVVLSEISKSTRHNILSTVVSFHLFKNSATCRAITESSI